MKVLIPLKIVLFFIIFSYPCFLNAQNSKSFNFKFNHVALSVTNLERSVAFYKNVLKLIEITNRTQKEGIRWFSMGEDKELHLISTVNEKVVINKAVHFALSILEFDNFILNLESNQILYSDWSGASKNVTIRADGIKQVYFQDPDGYWIEVNSVEQSK